MTALEDLNVLLQNLPNSTNVVLSLEELRTALTAISPSELIKIVPQLSFATLFQYVDTEDRSQLECCCDILKRLLKAVLPSVIITHFKSELEAGLQHHSQHVVELCLTQILRVVENEAQELIQQTDIIKALVKLLASDQLGIASKASSCLIKLGSVPEGVEIFLENCTTSDKNILKTKDIVKYRIYEVVVRMIINYPDALKHFESKPNKDNLLEMMISELSPENPDILGKLNVLEFVSDLVSCSHGFKYLEQHGFIAAMENSMDDALNDSFFATGYMKFFGCLCFVQPDLVNSRFKNFVNFMFSSILKKNPNTLTVAVETLGIVGSLPKGKLALHNSGQGMAYCLPVIGQLIVDSPAEMKLKALRAVEHLLSMPDGELPEDVMTITEGWFHQLYKNDPLSQIISVCQQPFPDLKSAAFAIIKCLAKLPWGQSVLKNNAGFQEYLLDRNENIREGVMGKFEVVQILVRSPFTQQVFGSSYYLKLKDFEGKGPYYSPAAPQVAIDEA